MNRYQREKVKRLKKLEDLGVNYYERKRILRRFDMEKVDIIIEQISEYKKCDYVNEFDEIENIFQKFVNWWRR